MAGDIPYLYETDAQQNSLRISDYDQTTNEHAD